MECCYAEFHNLAVYAKCRYAECRGAIYTLLVKTATGCLHFYTQASLV